MKGFTLFIIKSGIFWPSVTGEADSAPFPNFENTEAVKTKTLERDIRKKCFL